MNLPTHALLPVVALGCLVRIRQTAGRDHARSYPVHHWLLIGLCGALPDLLNPHVSLEARHASWSHTVWFWALISTTLMILPLIRPSWVSWCLLPWLSTAYGLHLMCDAISGGIAWNYPFSPSVVGDFYVHPLYWIPLDAVVALTAYVLFRVILPVEKFPERLE